MAGTAYGVVVGMQDYSIPRMPSVRFARADAEAFAGVLTGHLGVPPGNVTVWLDANVNMSNLTIELPAIVSSLRADDRFYFFYAGHGLWTSGSSRLTVYDTHPENLFGSTVELEKALLMPLRTSPCRASLVFIDACAQEIVDPTVASRDITTPMSEAEFRKFIADTEYAAAYFACSRKEKSHSTAALGHGIWTHHVIRALKGLEPLAAIKGIVTGQSLLNYLKSEVPRFIRDQTQIRAQQTPYGLIGASGDFEIASLPVKPASPPGLTIIKPDFASASFRSSETRPFDRLPGFSKARRNTVPDNESDSANGWAQRLLGPEVQSELQTVHDNAKRILGLKRKEISIDVGGGEGSVAADSFRFEITTGQSSRDPGKAFVLREIILRVPAGDLPDDFDDIFPEDVDRIVVPISGDGAYYEDLADALEEMADAGGGQFDEDKSAKVLKLTLQDGSSLSFDTKRNVMTIKPPSPAGCLAVVAKLGTGSFAKLLGSGPLLIGSRTPD